MFNLRLCNVAIIRYSQLKFGHMYLCGMDYKYFSPHCCNCNSFGCAAAIRWGNACHGPHSDSLYSGSEHSQFNSPRLVKHEAGFPNPRRALIGSNQLWRVNDHTTENCIASHYTVFLAKSLINMIRKGSLESQESEIISKSKAGIHNGSRFRCIWFVIGRV